MDRPGKFIVTNEFGKAVKKRRKELGLTQKQLGERGGTRFGPHYIPPVENGTAYPMKWRRTVEVLADALELTDPKIRFEFFLLASCANIDNVRALRLVDEQESSIADLFGTGSFGFPEQSRDTLDDLLEQTLIDVIHNPKITEEQMALLYSVKEWFESQFEEE